MTESRMTNEMLDKVEKLYSDSSTFEASLICRLVANVRELTELADLARKVCTMCPLPTWSVEVDGEAFNNLETLIRERDDDV